MQSIPTAVVENANAKILSDTPFQLERAPENGANNIDIAVLDMQGKTWLLIEGTVCLVRRIKEKTPMEREKYIDVRKGIKNLYKDHTVTQINVVFDFLGGYCTKVENELNNITGTDKKTEYIIIKCQRWLLSQNNETKNSTGIYNDYNSVTYNAETTKHRCHPHCCKRKYIKRTNKDIIILRGIYLALLFYDYRD